jgi:hypothetical protein
VQVWGETKAGLGEEAQRFEDAVKLSILPAISEAAGEHATQFRAAFFPNFMPEVARRFEGFGYGVPIDAFLPPHASGNIELFTLFLGETHHAMVLELTLSSLLMGPAAVSFKFDCEMHEVQLACAKVLVTFHQHSGLPAGTARNDAAYLVWAMSLGEAVEKQVQSIQLGLVPQPDDPSRVQCRQGILNVITCYFTFFILHCLLCFDLFILLRLLRRTAAL